MPFAITTSAEPMSASMAIQRPLYEVTVVITTHVLNMHAKAMFCWTFLTADFPSATTSASTRRSFVKSDTSAVSIATAVPATPIAMPTSAAASAGASLTPSPTMASVPGRDLKPHHRRLLSSWRWSLSSSTRASLSSGVSPANTFSRSTPTSSATAPATPALSPVSIVTSTPPLASAAHASAEPMRTVSAHAKTPSATPSKATQLTVLPFASRASCSCSRPAATAAGCVSQLRLAASLPLPISTSDAPMVALMPSPGMILKSWASAPPAAGGHAPRDPSSLTTAFAIGCGLCTSRRAAISSRSVSASFVPEWPARQDAARRMAPRSCAATTRVTLKLPDVSVPVLSVATFLRRPRVSR
mmetsp:Transcript_14439/g.60242  ORF Transcript_14439/g.60242 Transcript_14439/m.60242 type:complete len:358 (-) Transcript_14439:1871-2944(-)